MANQLNNKLEPEDIFAETEKTAPRPARVEPKREKYIPPATAMPPETPRKPRSVRWLIVIVIVIIVLMVAATLISATGVFQKKEVNVNNASNEVTNETVINTNLALPTNQADLPLDSDKDGLSDDEEKSLSTNPNNPDSDADGLFDREEVKVYKTNPLKSDSDGDGHSDGDEVKTGYDPLGPGKLLDFTNAVNNLTDITK